MPELLTDEQVQEALASLRDWTGDHRKIRRIVMPVDADGVVADVMTAADALNHHPMVERDGDAVTFVVWTHSAGGVTDLDLALARRIDEIVP